MGKTIQGKQEGVFLYVSKLGNLSAAFCTPKKVPADGADHTAKYHLDKTEAIFRSLQLCCSQ